MFTGLIEEIGIIKSIKNVGPDSIEISVQAGIVTEDLKTGDSISINGVCQTVTSFNKSGFTVNAVEETMKKTAFRILHAGDKVNLERSLTLNTRLGGHFVLGHCDTVGKICGLRKLSGSILIDISYDQKFSAFVVDEGSAAVEGISLTIAAVSGNKFTVSVIPHTYENTILRNLHTGSFVNIEFDILGKYVHKMLGGKNEITEKLLEESGFLSGKIR